MQRHWIVVVLSTLLSMGLLIVVLGQYQMMKMLKAEIERMEADLPKLHAQHEEESRSEMLLKKQVAQKQEEAKVMEDSIMKLEPDIQRSRAEHDGCQQELKKMNDELPNVAETEGVLKAEYDAWNQEIKSLRRQLVGYRPMCDYVMKDPLTAKLCGKAPS